MIKTAQRTAGITPFIAMDILERVKALEAQGRHVIQLQLG